MTTEHILKDIPNLFSVRGKTALITGGTRGLGLQAASGLLQSGLSTLIISSRDATACSSAVAALKALPSVSSDTVIIGIPANLSSPAGVNHLLNESKKHVSKIDILLANAGAAWAAPIEKHPDAAFQKVMDLNVRGVFLTIQAFLPFLEQAGTREDPARILITASIAGVGRGPEASYGYWASKAAVIHMAKNMAVEFGPKHITVNAIAPGFFPSKMTKAYSSTVGGYKTLAAQNPLGKLGSGEDFAGAVIYLSSRAGAHVNGGCLVIDGGAVLSPPPFDFKHKL